MCTHRSICCPSINVSSYSSIYPSIDPYLSTHLASLSMEYVPAVSRCLERCAYVCVYMYISTTHPRMHSDYKVLKQQNTAGWSHTSCKQVCLTVMSAHVESVSLLCCMYLATCIRPVTRNASLCAGTDDEHVSTEGNHRGAVAAALAAPSGAGLAVAFQLAGQLLLLLHGLRPRCLGVAGSDHWRLLVLPCCPRSVTLLL